MFFGAGNIVFPLLLGQEAGSGIGMALLGFIITAILIPFTGLISIVLFEGNYQVFFDRIGKIPSFIIISILMGLMGPFGGIPRLITLTFSTLKVYFSGLDSVYFILAACLLIFLFCYKKRRVLDLIGYVLSPILILSLLFIVVKGIFFSSERLSTGADVSNPFLLGLKQGYNTMDLIAAFFFSSLVYKKLQAQQSVKEGVNGAKKRREKALFASVFKVTLIGSSLLTMTYIGLGYVAAKQSHVLAGTPDGELIGKLGHMILGHYAGLVICMSIVLTCLTTVIALTVICADFLRKQVFRGKMSYNIATGTILVLAAWIACFDFQVIVKMLFPVLEVIYPSLLVLAVLNILYKLFVFRPIKTPVLVTIVFALCFQYII